MSLTFGIFAWLWLYQRNGLLTSTHVLVAIIAGHCVRRHQGRGFAAGVLDAIAFIGLLLGYALTPLLALGILSSLDRHFMDHAERNTCTNNLKHMGVIFRMFANESRIGLYPQLASERGKLMFHAEKTETLWEVFPEYLTDVKILTCPDMNEAEALRKLAETNPPSLFDDHSYFYLGYAITNDTDLEAFAAAYRQRIAEGLPFDADLPISGDPEHRVIYRLKQGVERLFITDINNPAGSALARSTIPVMWDRVTLVGDKLEANHVPGGANVLYMDGHVEFVKYPGKFPMTEVAVRILTELDALGNQRTQRDEGAGVSSTIPD